jgi:hypothetical protein
VTDSTLEARQLASTIQNWASGELSWEKAHVAALFSKGAYDYIPEFEFENDNRARVIPCSDYRERLLQGDSLPLGDMRQPDDDVAVYTVVSKLIVATIARAAPGLIFIAIRGTASLYDLFTDAKVMKVRVPADRRALLKYHRGFFQGAVSCEKAIWERVRRLSRGAGDSILVYFTGHSLGAAIASILYARSFQLDRGRWGYDPYWDWRDRPYWLERVACYSFGMPRYGNTYAVLQGGVPFHIYNEQDPIPTIPSRMMSYADPLDEYCISSNGKLVRGHRKGDLWFASKRGRIELLNLRAHDANYYVDQMGAAAQKGVR